ncbi:alpha/beta hydrolase family protein [Pontibacter sp. H249]|uniref:alpha/beta hydrolase family protein n=1 Tax=Pontibacter sp. H249 TaxID=3133420 RepID=UPI0030BA6371
MKSHLQRLFICLIAIFSLLYFPLNLLAQQLPAGTWAGDLSLGGPAPAKIIVDFKPTVAANALLSIPANGLHDLRAELVETANDSLRLRFRDHGMTYTITIKHNGPELRGVFAVASAGFKIPLALKETDINTLRPSRPQTPQAPFPYSVLPAEFKGGDTSIVLRGTITAPKGKKSVPGVILLSGSGPHNRDSEQFFHKTFMVLADELTRRGFAVMRYDERGVGESSGTFGGNFTEDFARDAAAAVKSLRNDKRLNVKDVYVIGHSEGSLVAQILAAEDPSVSGVILLAGVGLKGVELRKITHRAILRKRGLSDEAIETSTDVIAQSKAYETIATASDRATARLTFNKWFKENISTDTSYSGMYIEPYLDPWHFHHLRFDPTPYLRKVKAPVLAISGTNDSQTPAEPNLAGIKAGLAAGGNTSFTEIILPKLNHFMQTSITGAYDEPYTLEETFSPAALKVIGDWLEQQAGIDKKARATKTFR